MAWLDTTASVARSTCERVTTAAGRPASGDTAACVPRAAGEGIHIGSVAATGTELDTTSVLVDKFYDLLAVTVRELVLVEEALGGDPWVF